MHLALVFNRGNKTKLLAQVTLFEDMENDDDEKEPEPEQNVVRNERVRTGFQSGISST